MLDSPLLIVPLAAFLIGLFAVPAVRRVALERGFLDNPDRHRKLHQFPIALGGGIAVWVATWLGFAALFVFGGAGNPAFAGGPEGFVPVLAVTTLLILGLGIVDDRICLRGRHKLAGQIVAAVILVALGLRIDACAIFGFQFPLGVLAYPVSVLWILVVVNAFNLIDGMDGFCGTIGLISAVAIAFLAYSLGRVQESMIALALAGGLAAFLRYNLPPAKIYLGDAGSMTIGLLVAVLSVRACTIGPGDVVRIMPLFALMTLPLLDIVAAVGRRWLRGRSIFVPDRGHIHHCLGNRLGSTVAALAVAGLLAALGAGGAVMATTHSTGDSVAGFVVALSAGILVGTNAFGAMESRLLLFRMKVALAPLVSSLAARPLGAGQECHLHGTRNWAGVWDALVREGEASGVWRIELAIDMAAAGEVYYGHWTLPTVASDKPHWSIVHTLYAGGVDAGMISVAGNVNAPGSPYLNKVERLVRVVEDRLVADNTPIAPSDTPPLSNVNLSVTSALT